MTLDSVGTSSGHIRHPADADRRSAYEPQLSAEVTTGDESRSATIVWYFGETQVADASEVVSRNTHETLTSRVAWSEVEADGLVPGEYELTAELTQTGTIQTWGTVTVHDQQAPDDGGTGEDPCRDGYQLDPDTGACLAIPDDGTNGDDSDDSDDSEAPEGLPMLPPMGGLSAAQTTLAAIGGLVLLVVII